MSNFGYPRNVETQFSADIFNFLMRYFSSAPVGEAETLPSRRGDVSRLLTPVEWLAQYAQQAAQRMVTGVLLTNQRHWMAAAKEAGRGPQLYGALRQELRGKVGARTRQLIASNAQLIRSLPEEVRTIVAQRIGREEFAGERAEALEEFIPHVSRVKARLIARTETSKASTALTRARSEDLGLFWYVWRTSSDQRVRPSHKLMNGVLIAFDGPPSPEQLAGIKSTLGLYNAGDAPNCRCYPEPFIHFGQVSWPCKVYYGGRIQRYTLAAFRNIARLSQLKEAA